MLRVLVFLIFIILEVFSLELVVIGDKNFPENNLTKQEIKAIFLNKKRFIFKLKLLVMNHKSNHPLRLCFEKHILEKSKRSLEKYWRKAYYQGQKPPKIISSNEMLFLYLESVQPSIGYSELNATFDKEVKVLYRVECDKSRLY
jgi:ABC-type phosphate transport system substrate-binding protein